MADIEIKRIPRIDVKKAGTLVGTRPAINLIEGSNITLTVADDSAGNEVDVTIAASGDSAVPSDFQPAIVTGKYYPSQVGNFNVDITTNDQVVAWPIWFSHTETWTEIYVRVDTAGAGTEKIRLGLYANGANNTPGALIADFGEITITTSGLFSISISEQLTANTLYWLASINDDAGSLVVWYKQTTGNSDAYSAWVMGDPGPLDVPTPGFYVTQTYGALPDPFGTPDGNIDGIPAIWLRKV